MNPMLLENGMNPLSIRVFLVQLFQHKRKTSAKIYSARVTLKYVFAILKVGWRGLLTMLVANRNNVSNAIITCVVLHKSI